MKTSDNRSTHLGTIVAIAMAAVGALPAAVYAGAPTFYQDVLPILQTRCAHCHREGEVAPMALSDYKSVRPWAKGIRRAVLDKTMPPWFADPRYGHFKNDGSLTPEEIDTISRWVSGGALAGDKTKAPPPVVYTPGWQIGEPDQIFRIPRPYTLGAEGPDEYKYFTVETGLTEDKWVKAIEVRAGNPAVVHHIIAYIIPGDRPVPPEGGLTRANSFPPASPERLQQIISEQEIIQKQLRDEGMKEGSVTGALGLSILGLIAPGTPPQIFAPDEGKRIPAGSKLVFQMHYHRNGQQEVDQSYIGVKYHDGPVKRERITTGVINASFAIPPGHPDYVVEAWQTFDRDLQIHSFAPHLHLRGKSFEYTALYPDGRKEILLSTPEYDFDWQLIYELEEPLAIPRGTTIHCVARFDNSAENPSNPDPSAVVRFGEPTIDEMMIGFMDVTLDTRTEEIPSGG